MVLRFSGVIDESSSLQGIDVGAGNEVIVDLDDLDNINSHGSREWIKWVGNINPKNTVKFINCNTVFLDYANMIEGFVPPFARIETFRVPYFCANCNTITHKTLETAAIKDINKDVELSINCSNCDSPSEIDVIFPSFFKFNTTAIRGSHGLPLGARKGLGKIRTIHNRSDDPKFCGRMRVTCDLPL